MAQLDSTNLRLLELLQADARTSVIDLARAVDRAESTVRERIVSMERDGVLRGYRALVDPEKLGFRARAILRADCDRRRLPDVMRRLAAIPNVVHVSLSTGPKPLVMEVLAESSAQLEQLIEGRIAPLELGNVEVEMVLRVLVEPRWLAAAPSSPTAPTASAPVPAAADVDGLRSVAARGNALDLRRPAGMPGAIQGPVR